MPAAGVRRKVGGGSGGRRGEMRGWVTVEGGDGGSFRSLVLFLLADQRVRGDNCDKELNPFFVCAVIWDGWGRALLLHSCSRLSPCRTERNGTRLR